VQSPLPDSNLWAYPHVSCSARSRSASRALVAAVRRSLDGSGPTVSGLERALVLPGLRGARVINGAAPSRRPPQRGAVRPVLGARHVGHVGLPAARVAPRSSPLPLPRPTLGGYSSRSNPPRVGMFASSRSRRASVPGRLSARTGRQARVRDPWVVAVLTGRRVWAVCGTDRVRAGAQPYLGPWTCRAAGRRRDG
jgi:hypothetical protein